MKISKSILFVNIFLIIFNLFASEKVQENTSGNDLPINAELSALKKWQDMRVGIMISWGPVTLTGKEIGWSRYSPNICDWHPVEPEGLTPVEIYDNLYKKWNPESYDPEKWVELSKEAGMNYLVFITKHMDGFCLFDTDYTDYKITSPLSPYGKDITKKLADACLKANLAFSPYYCISDWHHPDYCDDDQTAYLKYVENQTRELCTSYGAILVMWFDNAPGRMQPFKDQIEDIHKMVYKLQPDAVINDRFILKGDYATAEQRVGEFRKKPWETCMTLGEHWSWNPDDKIKSLKECIQSLVLTVGSNGNFLLGVGPDPNGNFEPKTAERLREIGNWLKKYGQTIYQTRGGPFKPDFWSASTYRDDKIYLHILNWRKKEKKTLPPLSCKILNVKLLTGGKIETKQTKKFTEIYVPREYQNELDTIIELKLDSSAGNIDILDTIQGPFKPSGVKYSSYDKTKKDGFDYTGNAVIDKSFWTYWRSSKNDKKPWLEIEFDEPVKIDTIRVVECFDNLKQYAIYYDQKGKWVKASDVNRKKRVEIVSFEPVTTKKFRFETIASDGLTTLRQIQFFLRFQPEKN